MKKSMILMAALAFAATAGAQTVVPQLANAPRQTAGLKAVKTQRGNMSQSLNAQLAQPMAEGPQASLIMRPAVQNLRLENVQAAESHVRGAASGTRRVSLVRPGSNGNYYSHPEGSFFRGYKPEYDPETQTIQGMGSYWSKITFPLRATMSFAQGGTATSYYWKQGGEVVQQGGTWQFTLPYAAKQIYAPVVVASQDSFALGMNSMNTYIINQGGLGDETLGEIAQTPELVADFNWGFMGVDTIKYNYIVDDHGYRIVMNSETSGNVYNNAVNYTTSTSNNYLWGSTYKRFTAQETGWDKDTMAVVTRINQYMGKTSGNLYVEHLSIRGISKSRVPIKGDSRMRIRITGAKYNQRYNEYDPDFNNVLDTLYATAADTLLWQTMNNEYNGRHDNIGYVVFSKKTTDEFGNETDEPIIIPEGTQWCVVLDQFDDTTKYDFGPSGQRIDPTEYGQPATYQAKVNRSTRTLTSAYDNQGDNGDIVLNVGIDGMYDDVIAPENAGVFEFETTHPNMKYNTVRIPTSGGTGLTDGATLSLETSASGDGLPGAVFYTTLGLDAEGSLDYEVYADDNASWLDFNSLSLGALNTSVNAYYLIVAGQALPAGTSGRWASIYMGSTRGALSNPIFILQGNMTYAQAVSEYQAQYANGIQTVSPVEKAASVSPAFNLAGQRVGAGYKGVVIQNGKKTLRR